VGDYGGEIEDYCVNIYKDASTTCPFPSFSKTFALTPENNQFNWQDQAAAYLYHLRYRIENSGEDWITVSSSIAETTLENLWPCTNYEYQIQTICPLGISTYSDNFYFETECASSSNQQSETLNSTVQVFPNPFINQLDLTLPEEGVFLIELYDLQGIHLVQFETNNDSTPQLNINPSLPSGVYWLKISNGNESTIRKIVKLTPY